MNRNPAQLLRRLVLLGMTVPPACGAAPVVETVDTPAVHLVEAPAETGRVDPRPPPPPPVAEEPPPPPAELAEPAPNPVHQRIALQTQVQDALQKGDWRTARTLLEGPRPEPEHPDWQLLELRQAELALQAALDVLGKEGKALDPVAGLAALTEARAALRRSPALQTAHGKTLDKAAIRVGKLVASRLTGQEKAAQRVRAPAAAWLYRAIAHAALGGKPKALAAAQAAAELPAGADVLLQVAPTPAAAAEANANGSPAVVQQRVAAELDLLAKSGRLVRVLRQRPKKGPEPWLLGVTIERFSVIRERQPETRVGRFLDHIETVANPAWTENHGIAAAKLAELNQARDELQPVLDAVNATEAKIHKLQEQLQQILLQVTADNEEHYRGKPSPCKDKSLQCPETWGHKRWLPNITYYETRLIKENATLNELAPKLNKLESAVEKAQEAWDIAQRKAEETPQQMPQEVWLEHRYEVEVERLKTRVELRGTLRTASGEGYITQQRSAVWLQERSDFASPAVVVKAQVLQAEHAISLPDDASAVATAAELVVRDAVLPFLPALAGHGQRWIAEADAQSVGMQRLERLCRAWLTGPSLTAEQREQVAQRIQAMTGYDLRRNLLVDAALALELPK